MVLTPDALGPVTFQAQYFSVSHLSCGELKSLPKPVLRALDSRYSVCQRVTMSLVSGSTIYKENSEFLSDLENDVFLSQDEDELKEGQDALLGYRLEEELNRSIEKMRQMEEGTESNENICVENRLESNIAAQSLQESPTELSPSRGTSDELLEDIEMPSLSNSVCESADLVSISSGSVSPVKYSFIDWSRASSASFAEPPKRVKGDSTSFQAPAIPKTKELDVYEKIALLSAPEVPRITTLLSLNENGDSNTESVVTLHKSGDDDCEGSIHSETLDHVQEESANLTSSPVSSNHTALSFELLDMGKMNDDLLSSLLVTNSPIKKPSGDVELPASVDVPKTTSENPVNHNKVTKESKELIFVNSESKENSLSTASTSPLPSNHRMTLGTGIELLDIDEVNDSLMSSFRMAKTPILEDGEDFPLSTPLKEYEKKVLEEKLRKDKEGSVYQNDCIFNHVVNPLNETHSLGNRSKSLNDIPVKGSTVVPLDTTYACLERLLGSNSGIFDLKDYASAFNATFNPKQVKPSLSCDNVREMCKENADPNALAPIIMYKSNEDGLKIQTLNTQAAPLTNTTFDAKKSPLVNRTFQLGIDKINSTFEKSEKICTENNRMDTTFEKGSEKVSSVVNSTFDKIQAEGTDPGPLNVTYEKGEYKIASLNESVNLMDAEEKVLKLILDSTPIKPFKAPPEAVSTPKDVVKLDSSIKRTSHFAIYASLNYTNLD
ncbi:hypothetical protein SK128_006227 [Halocaridina rubra]|uniref:Uncharacterized protein n=1 Tax=Halocaridina rubra TaxID=373956 RepID=A0AAN8WTP6_HALRR